MKKHQEVTKRETAAQYNTTDACARMGFALDVLLKAAPRMLDEARTTSEERQGRRRLKQEAA